MTIKNRILIFSGILSLLLGVPAPAQKISPALQQSIGLGAKGGEYTCWIILADKPGSSYKNTLEKRSLERRQKRGRALSYGDLPVSEKYIEAIKTSGVRLRVISSWLNAVSVTATAAQIEKLAELPYVAKLDLVARFRAVDDLRTAKPAGSKSLPSLDYGFSESQIKMLKIDELHAKGYTGSGIRILIIDTGFDRQHEALVRTSVVAERDFQRMVHPRDQYGDEDTLAWRPDSVTSFEKDQDTTRLQTQHGTGMLSIAGGYKSGSLIGSAYNADYVLAKTEKLTGGDFSLEEDWFVAALQWGDSLGVDIASSSLGYRQWEDDTVRASYTYGQMNGDSALCSRAADSAASRGILVVNSLGNINPGNESQRPDTCLAAPADADSILSVGGAWPGTGLWAYSPTIGTGPSAGPTADSIKIRRFGGSDSAYIRRIKPDISAAWQTAFADNMDTVNYSQILTGRGTSGAAALTAGLCALLLEAHPAWGSGQVMEALKYSGSNRATVESFMAHPESLSTALGAYPGYNPGFSGVASGHKYYTYIDSTGTIYRYDYYDVYRIGWGIPDGVAALNFTTPEVVPPESDQLLDPYPNPAKPDAAGIYLPYFLARDSYNVTIRIYTLDGRMIRQLDFGTQLAGEYPGKRPPRQSSQPVAAGRPGGFWDLKDGQGKPAPSGLYLVILSTGWNQSVKKVVVVR